MGGWGLPATPARICCLIGCVQEGAAIRGGCSCQTEDELGTMLPSTSMSMRWNGRSANSKTAPSFSFIRVQVARPSQTPVLYGTNLGELSSPQTRLRASVVHPRGRNVLRWNDLRPRNICLHGRPALRARDADKEWVHGCVSPISRSDHSCASDLRRPDKSKGAGISAGV